ncbi:MAG TPA: helix-turn-helix domain-containing protein [Streptosporangiaceae bacterium]|jgi:purine catabolism regulator
MPDLVRAHLTIGDLLDRPELGLTALTAVETAPRRRILGAHAIEIAQPTRWVPAEWIMFTTGLRLRGRAAEQRALVAELDEHGIAALVYCEGIATKRAPAALLDEARARDFPVLALPLERPTRTVLTWIQYELLSTDAELFQRAMATQELLVGGALDLPDATLPEWALAARLRDLLHADVALVSVDGRVLFPKTGTHPGLADAVAAIPVSGPTEITLAGRPLLAMPVRTGPRVESWLVAAIPEDPKTHAVTWTATQATARLLTLVSASRTQSPAARTAQAEDLLHRALNPPNATHPSPAELDRAARVLGFDFGAACRGFVVRDGVAIEDVHEGMRGSGVPYLAGVDRGAGEVVGFAQGDGDELRRRLAALPGACGIGRPVGSVADAAVSVDDARFALDRMALDGDDGRVADFSAMRTAHWLVARDRAAVRERCEDVIAPLRAHPLLLEALVAYLREDQDMVRAAGRLRLHPNSLRYRMGRVEAVLGGSLRDPAVLTGVYSALVLARLI